MKEIEKKEEKKEEEHKEEEAKQEQKQEKIFKVDEYYPEGHRERAVTDSPLSSKLSKFW